MTTRTVRVGNQDVVMTPAEAEDGSFIASVRGDRHAERSFATHGPRVRGRRCDARPGVLIGAAGTTRFRATWERSSAPIRSS
jgi:hypothetical protein